MSDNAPDVLAQFAKALGVDESTATPDTVLATLTARLGDAAKVTTERDEAVANAAKVASERNAERIDSAVALALGKSGIIAQNTDDAAAIIKATLEVNKEGRVVTKTAPHVVPGQTPEQFIAGQLRTLRPHYWPPSQGGGAQGTGNVPAASADVSCFRTGSVTEQMALIGRIGERATIEACRRSGIAPPAWLLKGGGR